MTTNFISHNDLTSYFTIKSIFDSSIKNERFKLSQWKNAYLSNRKLGDEYRYVFERKYLKTFPGNSLVHPQILLKRMKIRETTFEQEVANLGDPYQNIQVQMMNRGYSREFAEKSVEREAPRFQVGIGNVPHYNRHSMHDGLRKGGILKKRRRRDYSGSHDNHTQLPDIDQYKSYLNFLKHSGILKSNLVPDKNGNVSFTVPGGKYTNLIVIASDNENIVQTNINLPSHPAKFLKRNLNLKESLDPKKNFNEVRKVLKFSKDGKHKIKDMTSADYNIIDTLEKVKNIQLEIAKMDGCDICPDLLFLTSWHRLTFEEQIKKYTLYISHEVHLFLYFKDKPFFDKVVKPFLMNKFERSFIDYWLLEDYEEIEKYSKVEFFDMLNSVEK